VPRLGTKEPLEIAAAFVELQIHDREDIWKSVLAQAVRCGYGLENRSGHLVHRCGPLSDVRPPVE
jgi:hypothetical protein